MYKAITTIVLFALLALFPWIQGVSKLLPDAPLNENRVLAKLPDWNRETAFRSYASDFQKWFNDHYPSRCFLIRLKTQIDYSVFDYSDRIHIGRDGWLYHRSTLDVNKPEVQHFGDDSYKLFNSNLKQLHDWLQERGIRLVIMDNEMKDVFYPQYLPRSAPRPFKHSNYQEFRENLAAKTGCLFLDSTKILKALQKERTVFHRTDLHWNDPAAFVVGKSLVEFIADQLALPNVKWKSTLSIRYESDSGGEASFMPLFRPARETALFLHEQPWDSTISQTTKEPFEFIFQKSPRSTTCLPTTVIFGDSFVDGMLRSGLARHFNAFYRARLFHCSLSEVLKNMPADTKVFIIQFSEQNLGVFGPGATTDYSKIRWPAPPELANTQP